MDFSLIIIGLALSGVLSYILTKINKKIGSIVTILSSLASLILVILLKDYVGEEFKFSIFTFKITNYGWFFSMLMVIVYSSVSFFNTYWMNKLIHPSIYNLFYILSLTATLGVFASKSLLTMFILWEIVVWSSMFIIPLGKSRKAAVVYYVISTIGSFAMLFGMFILYSKYNTFDINYVFSNLANDPKLATGVFFLFMLAGISKLGIFPLHIWLPIAHGNAPHTFSPVLSGGLVKLGGFISFLIIAVMPSYKAFSSSLQVMGVPYQNYLLMILGAISIIVGTLMAIKQEDFKKLIAYSSVSNGGYILIGIALTDQLGLAGGLMHMFNHAIASATVFLTIAAVAYRTGTTKMSELGGLIHRMPITYTVYLIAIISMAGIPPMSGFISKWLIYQSLARKGMVFMAFAAFFGSIGSFLYVFRPLSAVFLGQLSPKHENIKEAPIFMIIPMVILSGLTLFYGILPGSLLKYLGKIQESIGMKGIVVEGTKIMGNNGSLDPTLITVVFAAGFVIALAIFLLLPKSRKVGLMDTYTAAEFIYTPELYHYSYNFYAPFERLYKNHPSVLKFFESIALRVEEFGKLINYSFFSYKPGLTVFWITIVTIVMLWGGRL